MGYSRPRRTIHLVFAADSDHSGLEVQLRSMTMGEYFEWYTTTDQQAMLADRLVSWNVEDEQGKPVPASAEGLLTLEPDEVRAIKTAWIDAMVAIRENDPLALRSTSGLQGLLDLPTEPLPAHQSS